MPSKRVAKRSTEAEKRDRRAADRATLQSFMSSTTPTTKAMLE